MPTFYSNFELITLHELSCKSRVQCQQIQLKKLMLIVIIKTSMTDLYGLESQLSSVIRF